jgi:hypothetical protein
MHPVRGVVFAGELSVQQPLAALVASQLALDDERT